MENNEIFFNDQFEEQLNYNENIKFFADENKNDSSKEMMKMIIILIEK